MKLRHVAIVAFGWFVLLPPTKNDLSLDLSAPLSEWTKFRSFESLHDCILGAGELNARGNGDQNIRPAALGFSALQLRQFREAICASDDDLRLEVK